MIQERPASSSVNKLCKMIPANNPILSYELNRKVIIVVVLFFVEETSKEFQKDYQ